MATTNGPRVYAVHLALAVTSVLLCWYSYDPEKRFTWTHTGYIP